jgi:hypothetical protein
MLNFIVCVCAGSGDLVCVSQWCVRGVCGECVCVCVCVHGVCAFSISHAVLKYYFVWVIAALGAALVHCKQINNHKKKKNCTGVLLTM